MSVDLALHLSNKLSGDWSASGVVGQLSESVIDYLSSPLKWGALVDPLVRTRLLLAPLFLRLKELQELRPALEKLRRVAAADSDEWVRLTAAAVGPYDGRLHTDAVLKESKMVQKTLEDLRRRLEHADPAVYRPLEEKYFSAAVMRQTRPGSSEAPPIPPHSHFTLRDPATAPAAAAAGRTQIASAAAAAPGAVAAAALPPLPPRRAGPPAPLRPAAGAKAAGGIGEDGIFLSRKPIGAGPLRPGGLAAKFAPRKKTAAILDVAAVASMNRAAQAERERQQREAQEAKDAEARAKAEAKAAEKAAKGERKTSARAAKEAEALAAKEAQRARRDAERAQREADARQAKADVKEAEARVRAEQKAAEKAAEQAAKLEAKRAEQAARLEAKRAEHAARAEAKQAERADKAERKRAVSTHRPPKRAKTSASGGSGEDEGHGSRELDYEQTMAEYYSHQGEIYSYDQYGQPVTLPAASDPHAVPAGPGPDGVMPLMTPEEAARAIEDAELAAAAEAAGLDYGGMSWGDEPLQGGGGSAGG